MSWINVKDELPHEDVEVLAFVHDPKACAYYLARVDEYDDWFSTEDDESLYKAVTHWALLPHPPINNKER